MPLNPIVRASDHPYFLSRVSNARCGPVEHGGLAGNTGGKEERAGKGPPPPPPPLERYEEGAATACV